MEEEFQPQDVECTGEREARPKRGASQVTDFKAYHRTGAPGTGKVAAAVLKIETPDKGKDITTSTKETHHGTPKYKRALSSDAPTTPTESNTPLSPQPEMSELDSLKEELKRQREANEKIKTELEEARLRNEIDREKMKQLEWQTAKQKLEEERASMAQAHEEAMKAINEAAPQPKDESSVEYLKQKLAELTGEKATKPREQDDSKQKQVADQLQELRKQQQQITQAAKEAAKDHEDNPQIQELLKKLEVKEDPKPAPQDDQARLMEHLLSTLQGKEVESQMTRQKEILRQFLVDSNKTSTTGGATTLKPELLKKLSGESDTFNMTEWLAKRNRHQSEEAQCDPGTEECKQHKKSGMLEKATTNIQQKQTWPQKNLLEDWADEDLEFKHLQFEHMVAGETRTIEMGTDPAQILGRLRLLRRMAYAKLRGYEWPLIRKMYAAILRSIETRENTWENNFDRYEAILYKRAPTKREDRTGTQQGSSKKWFCRDWNKGNCSKSAPHKAWFGTGTNAIQRTVLHMCATCYMKDKTQKDHPEGSENCPHKDA